MSQPLPIDFQGVALAWAAEQELATIAQRAHMQEGDLVGALQKTLDLVGQLRGAALQGPLGSGLIAALDAADALIRRGVVEASYRWAVGGVPETAEPATVDSWDVRLPPDDGELGRQPLGQGRDRRPGRPGPRAGAHRGGGRSRNGAATRPARPAKRRR